MQTKTTNHSTTGNNNGRGGLASGTRSVERARLTAADWEKTHSDFKTTIDGKPFVLRMITGLGTCLVPVEII